MWLSPAYFSKKMSGIAYPMFSPKLQRLDRGFLLSDGNEPIKAYSPSEGLQAVGDFAAQLGTLQVSWGQYGELRPDELRTD